MARAARRRRSDAGAMYWPGFVDVMATLLLVIIFLLSIFSLAQFLLAREISGRDTALNELRSQIAELTDLLALERANGKSLETSMASLSDELSQTEEERDRLNGQLGAANQAKATLQDQIVILQDQSAAQEAARRAALAELEKRQEVIVDLRSEAEKRQAQLASLRTDLTAEQSARQEAEATVASQEATIVDLRSAAERNRALIASLGQEIQTTKEAAEKTQAALDQQRLLVVDLRDRGQKQAKALAESQATLASERTAREELVAALNQRTANLESRLAEAEDAQRRLVVLSSQAAETAAARREALDRLAAAQKRLIVLQDRSAQETASLRNDISTLSGRAEAAEKSAEEAAAEAARSRQVIIDLRSKTDAAAAQIATTTASRDAALKNIETLNIQLAALRRQIAALETALDASEQKDVESQARIADLGRRLNVALAQKVRELSRYRSEFFGKLREILSDRSDIRVVGDRFVFQAEVLFPTASADINPAGREDLAKLADALIRLEDQIPPEINWVLRVDGHTDARPINNPFFHNNWELSAARAISVVQYLIAQGVAPRRLVAAGFGEFQPLREGDTEEALSANRRIELKLTER